MSSRAAHAQQRRPAHVILVADAHNTDLRRPYDAVRNDQSAAPIGAASRLLTITRGPVSRTQVDTLHALDLFPVVHGISSVRPRLQARSSHNVIMVTGSLSRAYRRGIGCQYLSRPVHHGPVAPAQHCIQQSVSRACRRGVLTVVCNDVLGYAYRARGHDMDTYDRAWPDHTQDEGHDTGLENHVGRSAAPTGAASGPTTVELGGTAHG